MDWYVIQVITGKENEYRGMAKSLIRDAKGVSLHVPIRRMPFRRRGKIMIEEKPVFPGYIFMTTPDLSPEQAWDYRHIPGFLRWLGHQGNPEALHDQDLQILQGLLVHGEILGVSRVSYDADMRIQVRDGPLKGLEGKIIRVDKRKQRARVRLDMYHNSFEVDFAFELISMSDKETSQS